MLLIAFAQAPAQRGPVAVVVTSRRAGADAFAVKLAARLAATLEREGAAGVLDDPKAQKRLKELGAPDPRGCQGAVTCVQKLAAALGSDAVVVSVDIGKVVSSLAVHVEAVTPSAEVLATSDFTLQVQTFADELNAPVAAFARAVNERLPLPKPVVTAPPPVAPDPVAPPLVFSTSKPSPPAPGSALKPLGIASGAVAVVAGGASLAFAVLGLQSKNAYVAARDGMTSSLSFSTLQALESSGNTRFTVSLICGLSAVVFAALATFLLVNA